MYKVFIIQRWEQKQLETNNCYVWTWVDKMQSLTREHAHELIRKLEGHLKIVEVEVEETAISSKDKLS